VIAWPAQQAVSTATSETSLLSEQVLLHPAVITMTYNPLGDDGRPGSPIESVLTCPKYK
jgi:hypothetical protein